VFSAMCLIQEYFLDASMGAETCATDMICCISSSIDASLRYFFLR